MTQPRRWTHVLRWRGGDLFVRVSDDGSVYCAYHADTGPMLRFPSLEACLKHHGATLGEAPTP